jgi:hypothetical protein
MVHALHMADGKAAFEHPQAWVGFLPGRTGLCRPLADTLWDGVVNGEERWITIGTVMVGGGFKVVVVVHKYPDPEDETWVHVISLREATTHERKRYEISNL